MCDGHGRRSIIPTDADTKRTLFDALPVYNEASNRFSINAARLRIRLSEDRTGAYRRWLAKCGGMPDELPELLVADRARWRSWLGAHHQDQSGVWLVLAKKHVIEPTRLSYDEALEEALCHGWIDGQVRRRDERTFRQRFTPRRARSSWSQRNVGLVARLQAEGLMHPAGLAAVALAKDDGRWDAAYAGQATIEVPADLTAALDAEPRAKAMFDRLSSQNRYAVLYRIHEAKRSDTRARRIERFVAMLARGETIHPQGKAK